MGDGAAPGALEKLSLFTFDDLPRRLTRRLESGPLVEARDQPDDLGDITSSPIRIVPMLEVSASCGRIVNGRRDEAV